MRFGTIIADPPWNHNGDLLKGSRPPKDQGAPSGIGEALTYRRMSTSALCELPVGDVAAESCHLFLWVTNGSLVALDTPVQRICRAWGFRPITVITWAKHRKNMPGTPTMGVGRYLRGASEHVVFAVRGSQKPLDGQARPTWFSTPRTPHSVKPDTIHEWAEGMSPGPRLEMFARRDRPGWWCVGNEAPLTPGEDIGDVLRALAELPCTRRGTHRARVAGTACSDCMEGLMYVIPEGREVFERPKTMSRLRAWRACLTWGRTKDIPQHAWNKAHTASSWRWYTCTEEQAEQRVRAMQQRKSSCT